MGYVWLFSSFLIVLLGHFEEFPYFGVLTAICGYSFFWKGILYFPSSRIRFWGSTFWFGLIQGFYLFWMTSIEYQGFYILFVYACLLLLMGLQWGFVSHLVINLTLKKVFYIASLWTILEWMRHFFLCGFAFNPLGLALTSTLPTMQWASIFGILGLSFWVMIVNLFFLKFLINERINQPFIPWLKNAIASKPLLISAAFFLLPLFYGFIHLSSSKNKKNEKTVKVALIQTGLLPSQKVPMTGRLQEFIHPISQWNKIFSFLKEKDMSNVDYIVLPEAALPYGISKPLLLMKNAHAVLKENFGLKILNSLPPLAPPFAKKVTINEGKEEWLVSNAYMAMTLANHFNAELIGGFDDTDIEKNNYNAGFHFHPKKENYERYEKQILLPLAESLPFKWAQNLTKSYGITEFFTPGDKIKIFESKIPFSISICYEEMFSELMRQSRKRGSELFVNITNDNWFPNSILPQEHFQHSKVRSIENGVFLMRACNNGVTCILDPNGRKVSALEDKLGAGVLISSFIHYSYNSLYTFWGDGAIISICLIFCALYLRRSRAVK